MANTIPNLDTLSIQEDAPQISAPAETQTPSAPTPIQEVNASNKEAQSSNNQLLDQMAGVQKLAADTTSAPTAIQDPAPEAQSIPQNQTQSPTQTQAQAEPPEPGTGSTPTSASASEGSGIQVDGVTKPSYTASMTPEEVESFNASVAMIETGEQNIVDFMTGNSPLDAMVMDKAVQQMRAGQSASLVQMKQTLAENGMTGKGEGNALLALMARDQNVAMGDMMSTLTIDARNRLEQWNKYGLEYGNKKFNKMKTDDLATLDYIIQRGGSPEEMNAQAAVISEKYGVVMPDFTDPNNMTNYNQSKIRHEDFQAAQSSKLDQGDWEGFKKAHNEMAQNGQFKGMAFWDDTVPKLDDFMIDYDRGRKEKEMDSITNDMKFMEENGNTTGAASTFANAFDKGGVFGTGSSLSAIEREKIEMDYMATSPEMKEYLTNATGIFNQLKKGGSAQEIQVLAEEIYAKAPNSALGRQSKLYIDNPELAVMDPAHLSSLEEDRSIIINNAINFRDGEFDEGQVLKYKESLITSYGEKGLTDKGRDLAKKLPPEVIEELGITDLIDDEDYQDLYAAYDMDIKKQNLAPDAKVKELEQIIMKSFPDDSGLFDSPSEYNAFRTFLANITTSGGYKLEDGQFSITDEASAFPWSEGAPLEYLYKDPRGSNYTESRDYTLVQENDDNVRIGMEVFQSQEGTKVDYQTFQGLFQEAEAMGGDFQSNLRTKLIESQTEVDIPAIAGVGSATLSKVLTNDSSVQSYETRDAANNLTVSQMKAILNQDTGDSRVYYDTMVKNEAIKDLDKFSTSLETTNFTLNVGETDKKMVVEVLEAAASGGNATTSKFVNIGGTVFEVRSSDKDNTYQLIDVTGEDPATYNFTYQTKIETDIPWYLKSML